MGVYYRLPSQDNESNELFFKELKDTSKSNSLDLMEYMKLLYVNMAQMAQTGPEDRDIGKAETFNSCLPLSSMLYGLRGFQCP